jgi:hypothetical protein
VQQRTIDPASQSSPSAPGWNRAPVSQSMKAPVSTLRWRNSACDGRAAAQFGLQPIAAFTRAIQEIGTGSRSRWSIRRELFGAIVDGVGRKANLTTRSHVPARPIHCGGSNRASRHGTHHGKQERKKPLRIIDLQRLHPFDGGVDVLQIMGYSPHQCYAYRIWNICVPPKVPPIAFFMAPAHTRPGRHAPQVVSLEMV